jgi:hypothetical protein
VGLPDNRTTVEDCCHEFLHASPVADHDQIYDADPAGTTFAVPLAGSFEQKAVSQISCEACPNGTKDAISFAAYASAKRLTRNARFPRDEHAAVAVNDDSFWDFAPDPSSRCTNVCPGISTSLAATLATTTFR